MVSLARTAISSPIGRLDLVFRDDVLCGLGFGDRWTGLRAFLGRRFGAIEWLPEKTRPDTHRRVEDYLAGELTALDRLRTDAGGTAFQQQVWAALCTIAVGETVSYTEIARRIGRPTATRAVAGANADNPIAIVIPCHRVIHADGTISGYGGGVERKRWLLRHESGAHPFRLRP